MSESKASRWLKDALETDEVTAGGGRMVKLSYYSVVSGNVHRCVKAESPDDAAVMAFRQFAAKMDNTMSPDTAVRVVSASGVKHIIPLESVLHLAGLPPIEYLPGEDHGHN